jgi:hypothetical protein
MTLTASVTANGNDQVILSTNGTLYNRSYPDSALNLAGAWTVSEFNVFGDCCGYEASFNTGATLIVRTTVDNGTTNAPSCASGGYTGETNNLSLVPPCCPYGGAAPGIAFMESSAIGMTPTCSYLEHPYAWLAPVSNLLLQWDAFHANWPPITRIGAASRSTLSGADWQLDKQRLKELYMKSFARKLESMKSFSPHRLGLLAFIFALTFLVSKADAQNGWFTSSIALLETDSNGSINVYFSAKSQCGTSRLIYVHPIIGSDDAKAMLAALLAWQAQSMQVSVYVQQCFGGTGYGQFTAAYAGISNW